MTQTLAKLAYQEVWQQHVGPLRTVSVNPDGTTVAVITRDGWLVVFDARGQERFRVAVGVDARSVAVSAAGEALVVIESGFASLLNSDGRLQWKKRVVPAAFGMISPAGNAIALVTRDPTVVMVDRFGRVLWTYRNLNKIPTAMAVAENGQTVAFSCRNDLGEGVVSVNHDGQPYSPFMGLDPVIDLSISAAGDIVVALDREQCVFCYNCVKCFGLWKGKLNAPFSSVSYADRTRQTLVAAGTGQLALLDDQGQPVWEHQFSQPLLRADLSRDAQAIVVATPEGRVGMLRSRQARDLSRLDFVEVAGPAPGTATAVSLRKVWRLELGRRAGGPPPRLRRWRGADQIEYLLVSDGDETVRLHNDLGEELWTFRVSGGGLADVDVVEAEDTVVVATARGAIVLGLDGKERNRHVGEYAAVRLCCGGAAVLLDRQGVAHFQRCLGAVGHAIDLPGPARQILGDAAWRWLVGEQYIVKVGDDGHLVAALDFAAPIACARAAVDGRHLLVGLADGETLVVDGDGEILYRNRVEDYVTAVGWDRAADVVLVGLAGEAVLHLLLNRNEQRLRVPLSGEVQAIAACTLGHAVVTRVDEVYFVDVTGVVRARYTSPDRCLDLVPSLGGRAVYLLAEDSLVRLEPQDGAGALGFLEV